MKYVLAHTPAADAWIAQYPRLYAYPKLPDVSGSELIILDSGAYGLSLANRHMDAAYINGLAEHYATYQRENVVCIAPDEFLNPKRSMQQFQLWHDKSAIPVVPVIQMFSRQRFDATSIIKQLRFYSEHPLPTFEHKPVIAFSNAAWRGLEFAPYATALKLALRVAGFADAWVHNLGAGWDTHDIRAWSSYGIFGSIDSIAWYTDANAGKAWAHGDDIYYANAVASQAAVR